MVWEWILIFWIAYGEEIVVATRQAKRGSWLNLLDGYAVMSPWAFKPSNGVDGRVRRSAIDISIWYTAHI